MIVFWTKGSQKWLKNWTRAYGYNIDSIDEAADLTMDIANYRMTHRKSPNTYWNTILTIADDIQRLVDRNNDSLTVSYITSLLWQRVEEAAENEGDEANDADVSMIIRATLYRKFEDWANHRFQGISPEDIGGIWRNYMDTGTYGFPYPEPKTPQGKKLFRRMLKDDVPLDPFEEIGLTDEELNAMEQ